MSNADIEVKVSLHSRHPDIAIGVVLSFSDDDPHCCNASARLYIAILGPCRALLVLDTAELSKATCCSIHGLNNGIVVTGIASTRSTSETISLQSATIVEKRQNPSDDQQISFAL